MLNYKIRMVGPDYKICVFCDTPTSLYYCPPCNDYKGLMTVDEWEAYTGETWEE